MRTRKSKRTIWLMPIHSMPHRRIVLGESMLRRKSALLPFNLTDSSALFAAKLWNPDAICSTVSNSSRRG